VPPPTTSLDSVSSAASTSNRPISASTGISPSDERLAIERSEALAQFGANVRYGDGKLLSLWGARRLRRLGQLRQARHLSVILAW
jgi:hypothetical protein